MDLVIGLVLIVHKDYVKHSQNKNNVVEPIKMVLVFGLMVYVLD